MDSPFATIPPLALDAPSYQELERRIHSLEDAVARLEDTDALEERVVARLVERVPQAKVAAPTDAGIIEERILARLAERLPPSAPPAAVDRPFAPGFVELPEGPRRGGAWSAWLLLDMIDEAKTLIRMLRDRRYQMAWSSRLVVLVLVPVILLTNWWLPLAWLPGVGGLFVNIVNLVLAFAVYRALGRETRRYRETVLR